MEKAMTAARTPDKVAIQVMGSIMFLGWAARPNRAEMADSGRTFYQGPGLLPRCPPRYSGPMGDLDRLRRVLDRSGDPHNPPADKLKDVLG